MKKVEIEKLIKDYVINHFSNPDNYEINEFDSNCEAVYFIKDPVILSIVEDYINEEINKRGINLIGDADIDDVYEEIDEFYNREYWSGDDWTPIAIVFNEEDKRFKLNYIMCDLIWILDYDTYGKLYNNDVVEKLRKLIMEEINKGHTEIYTDQFGYEGENSAFWCRMAENILGQLCNEGVIACWNTLEYLYYYGFHWEFK